MKNLISFTQNSFPKNKSAVAFFFLFFLQGTSIGNGHQGISYNGISLGEVADFGKINFQLKNKYDAKRERE